MVALKKQLVNSNTKLKTLSTIIAFYIFSVSHASTPTNTTTTDVCKTLNTVASMLTGISVVVVTLAIMWAGYKFLFTRADIGECGKILAAGVMIGSASTIAGWFMGSNECKEAGSNKVSIMQQENFYASTIHSNISSSLINETFVS